MLKAKSCAQETQWGDFFHIHIDQGFKELYFSCVNSHIPSAGWGYQITVRSLFGKKVKPRKIKNKGMNGTELRSLDTTLYSGWSCQRRHKHLKEAS